MNIRREYNSIPQQNTAGNNNTMIKEIKNILKLSWGLILIFLCTLTIQPIATRFAGRLGELNLAAIALANTIINILGSSTSIGMTSAAVTLLSQSYTGNGICKTYDIILRKSILINFLTFCICSIIFLNMESILLLVGQDETIARLTAEYLLWFIPGLLFLFINMSFFAYLQCQNIVIPLIFIGVITLSSVVGLQILFVDVLKWGLRGSSIGQSIAYFINICLTTLFVIFKIKKNPWMDWSVHCIRDLWYIIKLGIYGVLMSSFEWWAFEITIILAGTFNPVFLGTQSLLFNILGLGYALMKGISLGIAIRVGQCSGEGNFRNAKIVYRIGIMITVMVSIIMFNVIYFGRKQIIYVFTDDKDVSEVAISIMPYCAGYCVFANIASLSRAALRGISKQMIGTSVTFISYYVVALPVGISLLFYTELGLKSIWIGMVMGLLIGDCLHFTILAIYINWKIEVTRICYQNKDSEYSRILNNQSKAMPPESYHVAVENIEQRKSNNYSILIIIVILIIIGIILSFFNHINSRNNFYFNIQLNVTQNKTTIN